MTPPARRRLGLLLSLATAGVLAALALAPRPEALIPLREPPRPEPPGHSPRMPPPDLDGLRPPAVADDAQARAERNRLARRWHALLDALEQGAAEAWEAERVEARLWLWRRALGEVDEVALHRHLAGLLEREVRRLAWQAERGLAGPGLLERAQVVLERERHLAGLPPGPHAPEGYEALRRAHCEREQARLDSLVHNGLRTHEDARSESRRLDLEFPPVPESARPGG